jgi:hypothetical protein
VALAHALRSFDTELLLDEGVVIVFAGNAFEVALAHAVLLLAGEGLAHVASGTLAKALWDRLDFELGLDLCVPHVVVLFASLVVQVDWHVDQLVPGTEPPVAGVVRGRIQHCVFFVVDVHLDFLVRSWSSEISVRQIHF